MSPQLREQILAEWRGLRPPPSRPDRARPVAELLEKVMRQSRPFRAAQRGANPRRVEGKSWATLLRRTPARAGSGTASFTCKSFQPTVHYELDRIWKPQIVKRTEGPLRRKLIREVKFRVVEPFDRIYKINRMKLSTFAPCYFFSPACASLSRRQRAA